MIGLGHLGSIKVNNSLIIESTPQLIQTHPLTTDRSPGKIVVNLLPLITFSWSSRDELLKVVRDVGFTQSR